MTEEQQAAAMKDVDSVRQAAALHGIAENTAFPLVERWHAALAALEHYGAEMDRYESEVTLLQGRAQVNQERAEAAETALAALRGNQRVPIHDRHRPHCNPGCVPAMHYMGEGPHDHHDNLDTECEVCE